MDQHHSARLSCGPAGFSSPWQNTSASPGVGPSAPPIQRRSMVAQPWRGFFASLGDAMLSALARVGSLGRGPAAAKPALLPWQRAASRRRLTLLGMVVLSALGATALLMQVLPHYEHEWLRVTQISLFALLFAWVTAGFVTALMGFWVQRRGDPHALSARAVAHHPLHADARAAIIMPICNENVATVFAGLRATCESLIETGGARLFDVYVLSDTSDPGLRATELAAWAELKISCQGAMRVHYRWRQHRTKRKSGNVADF